MSVMAMFQQLWCVIVQQIRFRRISKGELMIELKDYLDLSFHLYRFVVY
jgi:hypothetical protein